MKHEIEGSRFMKNPEEIMKRWNSEGATVSWMGPESEPGWGSPGNLMITCSHHEIMKISYEIIT